MEKKLEVKDLQISFRTQSGIVKAVRDISFDLYKGETLAIVGESGSGKSVTSKAIIGILAGNSIVEGGEILYDGQDLLKISEDDFHKIRGDKISMIFQDPLSSLNPIIKVGKQLTEAMILKSKSSQKNARESFNEKLACLNQALNELHPENKSTHDSLCKEFDNFCIESLTLELEYNEAQAALVDLTVDIENLIFLIEHQQKISLVKEVKKLLASLKRAHHGYVVVDDEKTKYFEDKLEGMMSYKDKLKSKINDKAVGASQHLEFLKELDAWAQEVSKKEKPNFFTLGYYIYKNPNDVEKCQNMPIDELNKMTRKYIDDNFMLNFIEVGAAGLLYSYEKSLSKKEQVLVFANEALTYFQGEKIELKKSKEYAKKLSLQVEDAINRLEIVKNSTEYSFRNAIFSFIKRYFVGIKENPKNQRRYDRQLAKYNRLIEKGKKPTWQVIPPRLVDLELTKNNICGMVEGLIRNYEKQLAKEKQTKAKSEKMVELIDYLKEEASRAVYKTTPKMAKAKALKLLEEVGISEPNIRYNQYPFEFSGGMRQRIVIAIALSANPDILICDEPTTALDVTIQSQILELINKIKKERNLSVIFITHDLGVVANMADRIAVMYAGKIVEYGTSEDIFYDPRHPYTWALLSSMPDLDTKEKLEAIPGTPPNMIYPPKGDAFAERNKYAMEIDFEEQPPLFQVSDSHFAATWLLHPNAPKVEPPKIVTERIKRMSKAANEVKEAQQAEANVETLVAVKETVNQEQEDKALKVEETEVKPEVVEPTTETEEVKEAPKAEKKAAPKTTKKAPAKKTTEAKPAGRLKAGEKSSKTTKKAEVKGTRAKAGEKTAKKTTKKEASK